MRRWLLTAAALLAGLVTTGILLWYGSPERGATDVYVLTRDVPAGSLVGLESVRLEPVHLGTGVQPPLGRTAERRLESAAARDLRAGQMLQAGDLVAAGVPADRRLVLVPVQNAPPVAPGDRVDLLLVSGGDHPSVTPFMLGLDVRAVAGGGLVLAVTSRAASGLVFAATTSRLVAVVAEHASGAGRETAVASLEDAAAAVRP